MPALNFRTRFADLVAKGVKRQTIRETRKRVINVGDTLHLFTGQRTAYCKKLGEATVAAVRQILITDDGVFLDGERLRGIPLEEFVKADGFVDPSDFFAWFNKQRGGQDFAGRVIYWDSLR